MSTYCQIEKDVCILLCASEYDNSQIISFCLQIYPLYLLSSDLCLRFLQLSILMAQFPKKISNFHLLWIWIIYKDLFRSWSQMPKSGKDTGVTHRVSGKDTEMNILFLLRAISKG